MFPLSELKNINLKKIGLKISPVELYNPNGISLIDAIVRVGGCTGSFLSNDGLIVTNHHCAFGFVAAISDTAHDYINKGFLAKNRNEERLAKGLVCKITASYADVSARVLQGTADVADPLQRMKLIGENIKKITEEENKANPALSCEISEMFTGRTYVLFRYKLLKDVRLVYVPARSIGEYGGERDNWVWPRHSGDFAFLRAYVAPDGSAADYSEKNIPYKPVKFLKINPAGVAENDFVFVLGYPGRTFRHQPAAYYRYHEQFMLKYISDLFDWQIEKMEELSTDNHALQIKYAARIKSLANTTKNYKGKLQGFRRTGLTAKKYEDERNLQAFIDAKPELKEKYGEVIPKINKLYTEILDMAPRNLWFGQVYNVLPMLATASAIDNYRLAYGKLQSEDERKNFLASQQQKFRETFYALLARYDENFEKAALKKMLLDALKFNTANLSSTVQNFAAGTSAADLEKKINALYSLSKIKDTKYLDDLLNQGLDKVLLMNDPLLELAAGLNKELSRVEEQSKLRDGELNLLMAKYVDVKSIWKEKQFIPDANATLRFTYGYVRGYSPNDAEYHGPFTSLRGVIEKEDGRDYELLEELKQLYAAHDIGSLLHPRLNDLPVNFLYNLDTTGGNSGSPVLNASGELVGVNFDRAFTATINDYAWNESYSRSVGVDIRYVLWVLKKVAKADYLLAEMNLKL